MVAILITIYSEIWARVLKTPATTILMPTVIPLIPGGSLYYAMDAALRHDAPEFILKAQKAIGLAVALVAGIMIVTSLRRPIEALVHKKDIFEEIAAKFKSNVRETWRVILVSKADIFHTESLRILAERLSQSEIGLPLRQICYYSPPNEVGVFSTEIKTDTPEEAASERNR